MTRLDLLRQTTLFAGLTDVELDALALDLRRHSFAPGVIIFHRDAPGNALYLVESGRVRIFLLSETGQEITLNFHGAGDCFGELALLDGLPRSAGAITMEQTVVHSLHRDDFLRHLHAHPHIAESILEVLSRRLRQLTDYTENLAFLDVYDRVASKLLDLALRYGVQDGGIRIDLSLTQGELATWVVASRERVNKVLGLLRDRGLINLDGKSIIILDLDGLRRQIQR
ncbi:MAG: Crp/Fnr family transcriptional regulator [Anaerolineae bacterium]|nr:Crp/Fnr family transcriptional regulator [Anaerolineae bacterium]MCB9129734.1 Crp/Fnr family transcriptional regulator [Anaerolineales bacterium]MCB0231211.1 Crp/Fnr family transcriptional regulator [Anaerolineae bacterium]MCB0235651.1 Crp/Fnr family transcriptional regulator [Anaerolineae bacterium]MCB0239911.1 Crp/Fnr family transcriptional regulator [Anaerolineae bacterium]